MNVSPSAGMIWPYWPLPRVCVPGANQYVVSGLIVQLCAIAVPVSSPAGIITALWGGDGGPPPRIELLPHTRTGGDAGPAPADAGPAAAAGPAAEDAGPAAEDAGPGAAECSDVNTSQVRPASPAAKHTTSSQPMGHLDSRPGSARRRGDRMASPFPFQLDGRGQWSADQPSGHADVLSWAAGTSSDAARKRSRRYIDASVNPTSVYDATRQYVTRKRASARCTPRGWK